MERSGKLPSSLIVALVMLITAILMLITAYSYSGGSGIFPRFIGWIFIALTMTECLVQLKAVMLLPATETKYLVPVADLFTDKVLKEIKGFLWIGLFLMLLYLTGFLITVPLYVFAFLRLSAEKSFKQCTIMAALAALSIYILFVVLLQYRLFQGLLFGA
ncbi:MAG: tripartite tricarboxylate transporter TctB family protein [Gammaproteobacteria bacterium]|nr:tripartite tricarboxylate transporter TctB family protein [Gammaproteobacteria bacterium]